MGLGDVGGGRCARRGCLLLSRGRREGESGGCPHPPQEAARSLRLELRAPHPCASDARARARAARWRVPSALCGSPPGPAPPPRPCGFTCVGLPRRHGLPWCGAGPGARRILLRPGATSSALGLGLRVSPRGRRASGLRRELGLQAARVAAAPLYAVPQDVLDEEGGEWLALSGRPRLAGPGLGSPEHPGASAPAPSLRTRAAAPEAAAPLSLSRACQRLYPWGRADAPPSHWLWGAGPHRQLDARRSR